jgi:hypothetical protein
MQAAEFTDYEDYISGICSPNSFRVLYFIYWIFYYLLSMYCYSNMLRCDFEAPDIRRMDPQELALNVVFSSNFSANAEATADLGTGLTAYLSAWPSITPITGID